MYAILFRTPFILISHINHIQQEDARVGVQVLYEIMHTHSGGRELERAMPGIRGFIVPGPRSNTQTFVSAI